MGLVGLTILAVMACVPSLAFGDHAVAQEGDLGPGARARRLAVPDLQGPRRRHLHDARELVAGRADHARRTPTDPNDPAYDWPAEVDDAIQQAKQYGMQITMELSDAPGWASGHPGRQALGAEARLGLREFRRRRGEGAGRRSTCG